MMPKGLPICEKCSKPIRRVESTENEDGSFQVSFYCHGDSESFCITTKEVINGFPAHRHFAFRDERIPNHECKDLFIPIEASVV